MKKETTITSLLSIVMLLGFVLFLYKVDQNVEHKPGILVTGVLDSGEEVNARRACFDGKLYIYRWGAVLDDFGAPMKCVYDERLLK